MTATTITTGNVSLEPPAGFVALPVDYLELAGTFTVPVGDEDATASLVMELRPLHPATTIEHLRQAAAENNPKADVRIVTLPAGRAVAIVRAGEYRLPPEVTGQPETKTFPSIGAQVMLPTPSGNQVVILDCSTTNEQAWPQVAEQATAVAYSIQLGSES